MGIITKPYTFASGNVADGTQINADFDALIAGVGDTTTLRPTLASLGLDADLTTLVLPANTTISAAGAELINDANATAQLATLGAVATGDSRLSDARVASDVSAWAKAGTKPAYTPAEIGSPSGSGSSSGSNTGDQTLSGLGGAPSSTAVVGPASATDNAIVRFDATTGKLVQDSKVTVGDDGTITFNLGALANNAYGGIKISDGDGADYWFLLRKDGSGNRRLAIYNGQTTLPLTLQEGGASVGIGVLAPNANAILDVTSTTKAFMPPRMTTTQRDAIASPTEGMVIFNTTTHVLNFYYTSWAAV